LFVILLSASVVVSHNGLPDKAKRWRLAGIPWILSIRRLRVWTLSDRSTSKAIVPEGV
jgi:hypothetical protein